MPEKEIGKVRVFLTDQFLQRVFVFHHGVEPCIAPVAPDAAYHCRFPVPHMVVGSYDEACIHKFGNHVQISSGMLAESVDNLHNPFRPGSRDINPSLYLVTFVVRRKAYLMQHK